MKGSIIKRLEALEGYLRKDPLIVLARTDSGEEVKLPLRDYLGRHYLDFIKVLAGSDLEDVRLLLNDIAPFSVIQRGKAW